MGGCIDIKNKPCQICGNLSNKGVHFQVDCCRACSAFFRRAVKSGKMYRCQRGSKNCNLKLKVRGTPLCRYCRFQKCKQLGMCIKRDTSEAPSSASEAPSFDENPAGSTNTRFTLFEKNIDSLKKIKEIFELQTPYQLPNVNLPMHLAFLQTLEYGFSHFYDEIKPKEALVWLKEVGVSTARFREKWSVEFAKALMYCKEFADINYEQKILLYKHASYLFVHIERFYTSMQYGGHENGNYYMVVCENEIADLNFKDDLLLEVSNNSYDKTRPLWKPYKENMIKLVYKPMISLNLTRFELVYLLAQILWSTQDIKNLSPNIHERANQMLDQISTELHDYYVNERRLFNYSPRLVNIMKLIDGAKVLLSELQNLTLLSQVFNIFDFNADLSEICDPF